MKAKIIETTNLQDKRVWLVKMKRADCEIVFTFVKKNQAKRIKQLHDETMPLITIK